MASLCRNSASGRREVDGDRPCRGVGLDALARGRTAAGCRRWRRRCRRRTAPSDPRGARRVPSTPGSPRAAPACRRRSAVRGAAGSVYVRPPSLGCGTLAARSATSVLPPAPGDATVGDEAVVGERQHRPVRPRRSPPDRCSGRRRAGRLEPQRPAAVAGARRGRRRPQRAAGDRRARTARCRARCGGVTLRVRGSMRITAPLAPSATQIAPESGGDRDRAAADAHRVADRIGRRVDPRDRAVVAVGDPDPAVADGDRGRPVADPDRLQRRARARDRAWSRRRPPRRHPHRPAARGDRSGPAGDVDRADPACPARGRVVAPARRPPTRPRPRRRRPPRRAARCPRAGGGRRGSSSSRPGRRRPFWPSATHSDPSPNAIAVGSPPTSIVVTCAVGRGRRGRRCRRGRWRSTPSPRPPRARRARARRRTARRCARWRDR